MKLALAQLRKMSFPYEYNESLDLKTELDGFEDIISSEPAIVKSIIYKYNDEEYQIAFDVEINLTIEDAVSLKPLKLNIHSLGKELFSNNPEREDAFSIQNNTLDTKEAVIMLILSEKPMSTTNEEFVDEITEDEDTEDENINPAFASLKELL